MGRPIGSVNRESLSMTRSGLLCGAIHFGCAGLRISWPTLAEEATWRHPGSRRPPGWEARAGH